MGALGVLLGVVLVSRSEIRGGEVIRRHPSSLSAKSFPLCLVGGAFGITVSLPIPRTIRARALAVQLQVFSTVLGRRRSSGSGPRVDPPPCHLCSGESRQMRSKAKSALS